MSIENPAEWKDSEKWVNIAFVSDFPQASSCETKKEKEIRTATKEEEILAMQLGMKSIFKIEMEERDACWLEKYSRAIYGKKISDEEYEILTPPTVWKPFFCVHSGHGSGILAKWKLASSIGKDIED